MNQGKFRELLPRICDKETSSDPDGWTETNPLWGHCAVVSLLVQDYFYGKILRVSLLEIPEFAAMRSHYFNELPSGTVTDFTAAQFGDRYPKGLEAEPRNRSYLLSSPDTERRYKLLEERMRKAFGETFDVGCG